MRYSLSNRWIAAVFVAVSLVLPRTTAFAGTTGTLSGTVVDSTTNAPLAGAKVTAASPSQLVSQTTDGTGHFSFLSLSPDTYTVSVEIKGYEPVSTSGVTVVADNTRVLPLALGKELKTIGRVTTRSASGLVRPGTTADVYSINAAQQAKVAAAGGGGNLDSAFSALSTVPGVSIAPGQSGYIGAAATLSIRGGDYDQIGYQIDGIPVNRAFDNYPSGPTSSLGQQELQVYTGAPPASSVSEGISGYINQVIRTGTIPGFETFTVAAGGPTYYHKVAFEVGAETPNRRFSYYAGVGGYDQTYRYADNFDGASLAQSNGVAYGVACSPKLSASVTPSCYNGSQFNNGQILGPYNLFAPAQVTDRDSVVNLHYYVPHKDGSRDDFQALYQSTYINTPLYSSTVDQGGAAYLNTIGVGTPTYQDGYNLRLPTGGFCRRIISSLQIRTISRTRRRTRSVRPLIRASGMERRTARESSSCSTRSHSARAHTRASTAIRITRIGCRPGHKAVISAATAAAAPAASYRCRAITNFHPIRAA